MRQTVLVCGGRDYADQAMLTEILDLAHRANPIILLVQGGARGADAMAAKWALANHVPTRTYPADWTKHGKGAGPIRNQQMLDQEKLDLVIAFPGGRGTADMIRRAEIAGVPVARVKRRRNQP